MQEPIKAPPRLKRRFQIHLSTAIVLMFVAGGLMWMNTKPHFHFNLAHGGKLHPIFAHGWPCLCVANGGEFASDHPEEVVGILKWVVYWSRASLNLLSAILILTFAWLLCEWLIRRRTSRT
jgi:hypothetical protein